MDVPQKFIDCSLKEFTQKDFELLSGITRIVVTSGFLVSHSGHVLYCRHFFCKKG